MLDALNLADGTRLAVLDDGGLAAIPQIRDTDGSWRRAGPGDGAAEALLALLHGAEGPSLHGRFTVHRWAPRSAVGERAVGVDQTNESVIVGDAAVVKWATHLQSGPHPAPRRIEVLHANGFRFMPAPWGLVTWQPDSGAETMVVSVDQYLPGAVDGWTWAVDLFADAARDKTPQPLAVAAAAGQVGAVVAEMHAALAGTASVASAADAQRWQQAALATLNDAHALGSPLIRDVLNARDDDVRRTLAALGGLAGSTVIEGHGDLHVGQVLRCADRYVVTDFDGNPVLPPTQRALPIPAGLDVAGMAQSLAHAAIVARRHNDLDAATLKQVDYAARQAFLDSYVHRLGTLGHAGIYDPGPMRALRLQQVLREVVYAARHLPRWMYVPEAALPAVLDERIPG